MSIKDLNVISSQQKKSRKSINSSIDITTNKGAAVTNNIPDNNIYELSS
jgi:hypothetical protein